MLVSNHLEEKSYQNMLQEAIAKIPLYSSEWTNFNVSDPGITILENLTAFEALQLNSINQITPAIRQKLLKMVGFEGKKGRCARMLLAPAGESETVAFPVNQRFILGDLCYETNRRIVLDDHKLTGIWGKREDGFHDYHVLTDRGVPQFVYIFGKEPKEGDSVYFAINKPVEPGTEVIFYLTVADSHDRNPFESNDKNAFASLTFECYTEKGFVPIHVKDNTGCFLVSGEIRMRMPDEEMAACPELPDASCCVRARLTYADYDVPPKILNIQGFLFEVWQKESKAAVYTFPKANRVAVGGLQVKDGYVQVFCREEKSGSYRKYEEQYGKGNKGRFYQRLADVDENGQPTEVFVFDKRSTGYAPERLKNAIRIVVYNEEIMRRYYIGDVLGYDDQEMKLPVQNIVAESFCIIAVRKDPDGEDIYDFVRPGRYEERDLTYHLYEEEGRIVIEDAGAFIGAKLYIGGVSVTRGREGNVRENGIFRAEGLGRKMKFYNPGAGTGGCFRESLQQVKERFLEDLKRPYTAVTAEDYERIIKETPGLCIRKVRAVVSETYNRVKIVVMPGMGEPFPRLSDTYKKLLEKQIEDCRLLSTKVDIVEPAYLAVNVSGILYIKQRYENETDVIEKKLREQLDYMHSARNFGDPVHFDEIFRTLEQMDCVEYIYKLSLFPKNPELGHLKDNDVFPADHCLCYAGDIMLEFRTAEV